MTIGRQQSTQFLVNTWGGKQWALVYTPVGYDPTKKYPLILFNHGVGEKGLTEADLSKLLNQGLPKAIAGGLDIPFIVVSMQDPFWSPGYKQFVTTLPDIISKYSVDETSVFITGLSAGGATTWDAVVEDDTFSKKIAAIAPFSAAGISLTQNLPTIATNNIKVLAAVGDSDTVVNAQDTLNYVSKVNAANPVTKAIGILYPGAGHNATFWDKVYSLSWASDVNNPTKQTLYDWFLSSKKPSPSTTTTTTQRYLIGTYKIYSNGDMEKV